MRKNLKTKSVLFLIIFGIFFTPLSIQAISTVDLPHLSSAREMVNHKTHLTPFQYDDVVIDDLVMYDEARSSSVSDCVWGTPLTKTTGDIMNVTLENGALWAANFNIGNIELIVKFNYDAQTETLSFRKTLGDGMSYSIASDNSSITFYRHRKPCLIIENIVNCGQNACVTLHFLKNKTTISLNNCSTALYSTMNQGSINKPFTSVNTQHKMSIALGTAEDVNTLVSKKSNIVTTHQVAPNPINNTTTIKFHLSNNAHVRVSIYNALGQQIEVLVNQNQSKGEQVIDWKTTDILRGGIYFYEIIADNERMIGKVIKQ